MHSNALSSLCSLRSFSIVFAFCSGISSRVSMSGISGSVSSISGWPLVYCSVGWTLTTPTTSCWEIEWTMYMSTFPLVFDQFSSYIAPKSFISSFNVPAKSYHVSSTP